MAEDGRSGSQEAKRKAVEAGLKDKEELKLVSETEWDDVNAKIASLTDALRHEVSRRRDLEDDLEGYNDRLSSTKTKVEFCSKSIASIISVLGTDGEHKDMVRIIVVKKRGMTMKAFYLQWENFQRFALGGAKMFSLPGRGKVTLPPGQEANSVWTQETRSSLP